MNLTRTLPIAVAALALLAACGSAADEAAGVRGPATTVAETPEPADTTEAPETTVETAGNLAAAHEQCIGDSVLSEFNARHNEVGNIYRNIYQMLADGEGMTRDEAIADSLAEMYNADENTITISSAYDNGEYGMSEGGLLAGIVYDCVLDALAVPERVLDHIGTTRALDGQQEDSWDNYQARWTYHPDDGVNLTIWTA
jgi:hypothetical protein